jgi:hypothetical protein
MTSEEPALAAVPSANLLVVALVNFVRHGKAALSNADCWRVEGRWFAFARRL